MEFNRRTLGAIATFLITNFITWVFEASTGVSLDPFYYLDLILKIVTNAFPMPTTGQFSQSTDDWMVLVNLVHVILKFLPSFLLAVEVYYLIPDDVKRNQWEY